jgi:Recombinase zinc beta ribbon domain
VGGPGQRQRDHEHICGRQDRVRVGEGADELEGFRRVARGVHRVDPRPERAHQRRDSRADAAESQDPAHCAVQREVLSLLVELAGSQRGMPLRKTLGQRERHGRRVFTAMLTDSGRKRKRAIRSYLLTGLLRCSRCGTAMVATPRQTKTGGGKRGVYRYGKGATQRAYGCAKTPGGCGGLFIQASGIDAFVTDAVLHRLRGANLRKARRRLAKATLLSDIAADEAMLVNVAEDFAERRISRSAFHAATDRVQGRLDKARARLAAQSRPDVLSGTGIDDLASEWQALGLERQRAVIAAVLPRSPSDQPEGPETDSIPIGSLSDGGPDPPE